MGYPTVSARAISSLAGVLQAGKAQAWSPGHGVLSGKTGASALWKDYYTVQGGDVPPRPFSHQ